MRTIRFFLSIYGLLLISCLQCTQSSAQPFNKEEFASRRQQLMEQMDGGIALFRSAKTVIRNYDIEYDFRQESDFYYLTGFDEPESAIMLIPGAKHEFIMFVQKKDFLKEKWIGKIHGIQEAMYVFGADTAYSIDLFNELLSGYIMGKQKVYCSMKDKELNNMLLSIMKKRVGETYDIIKPPKQLIDPLPLLHEIRLIKSDYELDLLRRAIDITCDAHIEAMKVTEPGMFEYEIEAIIEYTYLNNGCPRVAFPSIVGSGPNAIVLHYSKNNRQTQNGELLLMDIGAEYEYYAADITRTIPVSGKFSKEQKEIYELVLEAQKVGIEILAPGVSFVETEEEITDVIKEGLYKMGLITDKESKWQYRAWYYPYVMHWLGLDVHDAGSYIGTDSTHIRYFEVGMVTTVEPGIYIGATAEDVFLLLHEWVAKDVPEKEIGQFVETVWPVAQKYKNIGIRIEDDVLITKDGCEVLSAKAPKEINTIEAMMQKESIFNQ